MGDNLNVLVRRLQEGDADAFEGIYEQTRKPVYYAILSILRDPSLSEDIMQDTYMRFLRNPNAYSERNFLAYLVTIARRLAINEYHSRHRTELQDDLESRRETPCLEINAEIAAEKRELIDKALSVLDPLEKNVVLLYNIADLTHREIAEILGKPLGTVTWLYARALKKIREAIRKEE